MFDNESDRWLVTFRNRYTGDTMRSAMGPYPLPIAEQVASRERRMAFETTMIQVEPASSTCSSW